MNDTLAIAQTLPDLLDRAVETGADAPAIASMGAVVSYGQLQSQAADLARGLLAIGVGKGTRVALLAGNTPFWIKAFFACAQVGALVIPISTLASPGELAHILRHSDAQVLLAERRYVGRDYADLVASALPMLYRAADPACLRLVEAPFLRSVWFDDASDCTWANTIGGLIAKGGADPALGSAFLEAVKREVVPGDDAFVIYTSGSTALPKAILHAHGPVARHAKVLADHHMTFRGERVLCVLPMFWVGGLGMLLETFVNDGCIVLPDGVSQRAVADALRDIGADMLHGWPAQAQAIRDFASADGVDVSKVRGLRDETLPDGSPRRRAQVPNSLGMTETFGPHCASPWGTVLADDRLGAFGPVIGGFERRVIDPATGRLLPSGEPGELQVRGAALMRGYYKRERHEVFTGDGFFATGDIVQFEDDGHMYFVGRSGDTLKTRGVNVSRLEVETALRSLPEVVEAVVCGLPDPLLGDRVVAAVAARPGADLTEAALKSDLAGLVARYKVPSDIAVIDRDEFLWTASGKIRLADMARLIAAKCGLDA